ncbi:PKD domain-containing protein, partial [Halorubrum sp. AD140]|uniref:PKD domain-containing protein n=1 Tax=Halorubrum sp. AD140 TaxID=3050073 RepID=UPI002ACC8F3D
MTRWRRLAIALVALSVVTAGIPMTGAFSNVSAERTVSVDVADDDDALLSLEPSTGPNGVYAEQSDGTLDLNFDGSGTLASGLNPDATTHADDVFVTTNRGTQPVRLTVDDTPPGLRFYAEDGDRSRRIDGNDPESVTLGVGEATNVSVRIDSTNESALEAVDSVSIEATASDDVGDAPNDGEDGSDGGENETGDGGDEGTPSDGGDDTGVQTSVDDGVLRATGSATAGESVAFDLGAVDNASQDDVAVETTEITYADDVDAVNTTVSVADTERPPGDREAPPNASVRTYLDVSHPETSDAAIENASFRFVLPHEAGTDAGSVSLVRYNETRDAWETDSTTVTYVENSSAGYVYEARTERLSLFALVQTARGIYVQSNGTLEAVDSSLTTDPETDFPADTYGTYRDRAFNASYWQADATSDADDAAAVIREELRFDLENATKDAAIDQAVSYADDTLQTTVGFSGIGTAVTALDVALKSDEFAGSYGTGIQKQAIAIHVDPGTDSYDELRANLDALERNTAELKRTDDEAKEDRLLEERQSLLRETYLLLPTYLNDVHGDVVGNAAGIEDPQAYQQIRSDVESLRLLVELDYEETTEKRYGAANTSLPRETSMPTHGWTAFGDANVYDTMDHGDDYAVFELDAAAGTDDADAIDVTVAGANAADLETVVLSDRPDDPRTVEGRELSEGGEERLTDTIDDPADTTYVVVRAGGSRGPLKLTASGEGGSVDASVVERAGPDVQRPEADLVSGPDPVTLADGDAVYPTNDSDTDLAWDLWDAKTPTDDLEYRFRDDDGDGFAGDEDGDGWTAWETAPDDGRVTPDLSYGDGLTRVQLQVRDDAGRTTVRNADVVRTAGPPTTDVAAPLASDPTAGDLYVRVLPERRIESVELQYRQVGQSDWTDWQTVRDDELDGFGRLSSPTEGEIEVRARATNLANETGEWATETLTYDPPDADPPEIEAESIPPKRPTLVDGEEVERRVVANESVELSWGAEDEVTATDDLEYRVRVDGDSWSEWDATENGRVDVGVDAARAGTDVTVEVRDEAGNVASRSVTLVRDDDPPAVDVNATDDVTGAVVDPSADEPLSTVELQYRADGEESWTDWETLRSTQPTVVDLDDAGSFELRARGVDTAGNVGDWTGPVPFSSLPADRSTSIGDEDDKEFTGGTNGSYEIPNASEIGSSTAAGVVAYNALVDEIDGELLLDMYVTTRDGDRYPISSVEFTEDENQTVSADLPGNLTDDARLEVDVEGNGTVVLDSLRAVDATPDAPPLAASPSNVTVGSDVTVSAPGDWTAGDEVVAYEWDLDDDGEYERETAAANATTAYDDAGERNVTLRLTDAFGASATSQTTVRANAPPTAAIEADEPGLTGESIALDAGDSEDTDGEVDAYEWDLDDDGAVEETGSTAAVDFDDDGTYPISLTVTDDQGATDTVETNVTVENRRPTAAATVNDSEPTAGEPVTFDAGESSDPDGEVDAHEWDLDGDGEFERTDADPTAVFEEPGERTVAVRVTDDDGATNETTVTVDVNAPPSAAIDAESPVLTDEETTLSAADSDDPDGEIVAYDWAIGGASDADGVEANRSFDDDGTYEVVLTVTDDQGATDTAATNVTVENRPPTAVGAVTTEVPVVGEPVAFDAGESSDPDGEIERYEWDLDDDGEFESNASSPTATYDDHGERTATLRVVDDDGATNETTVRFDVNAPPEPALDASDPELTDDAIDLDASESEDPDGEIERYEWDLDDDGRTETSGPDAAVDFGDDGVYPVTLTVTDDDETARSTTRNVTVENRPPSAEASVNDTTPLLGEAVGFDADDSVDPDGTVAGAAWDLDADGDYEVNGTDAVGSFDEPG